MRRGKLIPAVIQPTRRTAFSTGVADVPIIPCTCSRCLKSLVLEGKRTWHSEQSTSLPSVVTTVGTLSGATGAVSSLALFAFCLDVPLLSLSDFMAMYTGHSCGTALHEGTHDLQSSLQSLMRCPGTKQFRHACCSWTGPFFFIEV